MVIIANSNLAEVLAEQGSLHRATATYTQSLQMAIRPDGQRSPLAARIYEGLGRLSYERNEANDAERYIHQCIDLCRQWGDSDLQSAGCAMLARLERIRGNLEAAGEAMRAAETTRRAEQSAGEHRLPSRRSVQVRSDLARLWLAQGNLERLSHIIQQSGITIDDEIPYQRQPEYGILVRLLLARNEYESALALSQRLLLQAETTGRMGLVIETLILQALALQRKKDMERALAALERALALAQPEGFVRSFLDEGEAMTRLLCQAQSRQVGSGYAALLLSQIGTTSGMTRPSMQLLAEPLTAREVEVLQLIEAGCSNQEIAEQLVISMPTVKRHISNIYAKLGVKSRTQAVAIGKELRLFD
jgi:LuxR family maltose regulon positive regulatory protein